MSLLVSHTRDMIEAGCDEAGRGCLAGPVYAAAVILPKNFYHPLLNDSKQLNEAERNELRPIIEREALSYAVSSVDAATIDQINILNAAIKAMHLALEKLTLVPELILVDGNRFIPFQFIPHLTIVKGDSKYASIAAASVLAKTYRDEFMDEAHQNYSQYKWNENKGYPTLYHRKKIIEQGYTPLHRMSFKVEIKDE